MKALVERKNWLGYAAAVGLFIWLPSVLWSQSNNGGSDQDAFIIKTGATKGTIHLDLDTYAYPDKCAMYCPPRGQKGSKRINKTPGTNGISTSSLFPVTQGFRNVTNIVVQWNGGTDIEVVMNENWPNAGSSWDYNATLYPVGGKPIVVIRDPTMIVSTPPKVTSTGTIFQTKGRKSNAGKPRSKPGGTGKIPPRRRGYVTRMITPTTSGTGNTMGLTPKSTTNSKPGGSGRIAKVLFSGKGSITTHIRKMPTRSVRRIALRGGRP